MGADGARDLDGFLLPPRQLAGMFIDGTPIGGPPRDSNGAVGAAGGEDELVESTVFVKAITDNAALFEPGHEVISPRQEHRKQRWRTVLGSPGAATPPGEVLPRTASPRPSSAPSSSSASSLHPRLSMAAELAAADVTPTVRASLQEGSGPVPAADTRSPQQQGRAKPVSTYSPVPAVTLASSPVYGTPSRTGGSPATLSAEASVVDLSSTEMLLIQRDSAERSVASLRMALRECTSERDAFRAQAVAAADELQSLRAALAAARSGVMREVQARDAAQQRADDALSVATDAAAENDKLKAEMRALRTDAARLATDTRRLTADLAAARKACEAAQNEKAAAEAQVETERNTTRDLRDQLARADAAAAEKARAAAAAARSKAKAEAAVELTAAVSDTAERGRALIDERVAAAVAAAIAAEREAVGPLRARLSAVTTERDGAVEQSRRLQRELEQLQARLSAAESILAKRAAERDAAMAQANRDSEIATQLVSERAAMEEQLHDSAQQAHIAERQRDAALAGAERAQMAARGAERKATEALAAAAGAQEALHTKEGALVQLQSELRARELDIEQLQQRLTSMTSEHNAAMELLHQDCSHHEAVAKEASTAMITAQEALTSSNALAQSAWALAQERLHHVEQLTAQLEAAHARLAANATQPVSPAPSEERLALAMRGASPAPSSRGRMSPFAPMSPQARALTGTGSSEQLVNLELQLAEARAALDITGADLNTAVSALEHAAGDLAAARSEVGALTAERDGALAELEVARQHAARCHAAQELTVAQTRLAGALSASGAPRSVFEDVLTQWIADARAAEHDLLERLAYAEAALSHVRHLAHGEATAASPAHAPPASWERERALLRKDLAESELRANATIRALAEATEELSRLRAELDVLRSQQHDGRGDWNDGGEVHDNYPADDDDDGAFPLAFVSAPVAHSRLDTIADDEEHPSPGQHSVSETVAAEGSATSVEPVTLVVRLPAADAAVVQELRAQLDEAFSQAQEAQLAVRHLVLHVADALRACPLLDVDSTTEAPATPAEDDSTDAQRHAACAGIDALLARAKCASALVEVRDSRLRAMQLTLSDKEAEVERLSAAVAQRQETHAAGRGTHTAAIQTDTTPASHGGAESGDELHRVRLQLEQARHEARAASVERLAAQQELTAAISERKTALAKASAAMQARDALATDVKDASAALEAARSDAERLLQWCLSRGVVPDQLPLAAGVSPAPTAGGGARLGSVIHADGTEYHELDVSPSLADPPTPSPMRRLVLQ